MSGKKTDNHYLGDKVALRINKSPWQDKKPLKVLDCFGGKGIVWEAVKRKTGKLIERSAIDERLDLHSFHLHGDNVKILTGLDLQNFAVIDLDAYGLPYSQLKIIFDKNYKGTVFVTAIQTMNGIIPFGLLEEIGFSNEMIKKVPSLFAKRGFQYFLEYLALHGVKQITHRSKFRKHYLMFETD